MTKERLNEIQMASIFILSGLFLCLIWRFIPDGTPFYFPFLDISATPWVVSFNPKEVLSYPLKGVMPMFVECITPVYLLPSALAAGNMWIPININYKRIVINRYNIWYGIILFEFVKSFDFLLTYRQTYLRIPFILALMIIQTYYLYYSSKQVKPH